MRSLRVSVRVSICLLFLGPTVGRSANAERPDRWIATEGNPPAVRCHEPASECTAFAADELRHYLTRILGTPVTEETRDGETPVIQLSIDANAGGSDEAYTLRAEGNTFHIIGAGPAGLVFGTYEFLRRYGGCRFSHLGPDGEYVPRKERIEASALPLSMAPKLWYRGLQFYYGEDAERCRQRIDWMAKNGMNYVTYTPAPEATDPDTMVHLDPQSGAIVRPSGHELRYSKPWFDRELRPEVNRRGLKLDMNHHNFLYWLPPNRYLEEHPEWYSLVDGKRGEELSQLCICTSNADAVATLIENVRKYLRENPEVKIIGVIPEDGVGMCQCEKCVAGDPDPKEVFRRRNYRVENRSKSSRYHRLLNAVAAAISDEFPDVTVGGAAYVDLLWPARDVKFRRNLTIWVALYWRDGCRPMNAENTSDLNRHFLEILRQWKAVFPGRLIAYEYYMGMSAQSSLPYPISEVICEDWLHLKQLGIEGATVQSWTENHNLYALNNLAFARSGWYDRVDHAQLLDDYLLGAYGAAAEEIRPIYMGMVRATREYAKTESNLLPNAENISYFLDAVGRDTIQGALAAARDKATAPREQRQIERLSSAVGYWEMAAEIFKLRAEARQLEKTDPKAAADLLDKCVKQLGPQLQQYVATSMPPGWHGVRVPVMWGRTLERMSQSAEKLRK